MKVGFSTLLWTAHVEQRHFPLLARLAQAGYDGVEVLVSEGQPHDYAVLARELDDLRLERTACFSFGSPEVSPIGADASQRRAAAQAAFLALERTAALGATVLCGPIHSPLYHFTWTGPTAEERQRALAFHHTLGERARELGVTIALEALNRYECYFLTSLFELRTYLAELAHPSIRGTFDSFHANIEEADIAAALAETMGAIAHVQLADNDRGIPGRGHIDFDKIFSTLRAADYDDWIMLEIFGHFDERHAGLTNIWRPLVASEDEVIEKSLLFVRRGWSRAGL